MFALKLNFGNCITFFPDINSIAIFSSFTNFSVKKSRTSNLKTENKETSRTLGESS